MTEKKPLKIIICCGGGFSSSALALHLEKDVEALGLTDRAVFEYHPFHGGIDPELGDIFMFCPHLELYARQMKETFPKPIYIIPPRLYGLMPAEDFVEDAEDAMALWEKTHTNIVTFEDEPRPLAIKRSVSHRKHLAQKQQ